MPKYDVTITETLQTTVEIKAQDRFHAEQIASDNWRNGIYSRRRALSGRIL